MGRSATIAGASMGPDRAMISAGLAAEADRIAVLLRIVQCHRSGAEADVALKQQLAAAQERVDEARRRGLWKKLLADHDLLEANLSLVMDSLSAALLLDLRPSCASTCLGLQGGREADLTQALLHELLMLRAREETELQLLLSPVGKLVASRLLRLEGSGVLRKIYPSPKLMRWALGKENLSGLPSGMRVVDVETGGMPELIVHRATRTRIDEVVFLTRHYERMRAQNRPIGGGPAVLFIGAPGTGKSLAARHVAHQLQRPLLQLDLGSVVSKWVGETERNLSRIFGQIAGTGCCILIDEADALLGKRVSVKEGRDHYANITVSHILSLLEVHDGLVILTSNMRANLDNAYTRRFSAVVEFKRPDALMRQAVWAFALQNVEISSERNDLAQIAASVELSAAEIHNACHLAAALAHAEQRCIVPGDLARAVMREKTKTASTFARDDLHDLALHLENEL